MPMMASSIEPRRGAERSEHRRRCASCGTASRRTCSTRANSSPADHQGSKPAMSQNQVDEVNGLLEAAEARGKALAQSQADLSQRLAALHAANAAIRDSRQAALNLMEDAVLSRQAVEALNATLHERERRFRAMVDALPAAIYTTDAEGWLTHFNPAAVELSGRTPDIRTDRWHVAWQLYRSDGSPLALEESAMAIALKEGRVLREEVVIERPDGTRRCCMPYPTPLSDSEGRLVGGINMLVDVTDRRQAEDALRQSEPCSARWRTPPRGSCGAWTLTATPRMSTADTSTTSTRRRRKFWAAAGMACFIPMMRPTISLPWPLPNARKLA
jgi:PAS domain S-box-containing protein